MAGIQIRRQRQIVLFVELIHDVPLIVDADGQHLKLPVLVRFEQGFHLRHFLDARQAPGAPDIQKHDLAAIIAQLDGMALLVLDGKIRSLLSDVDDARFADAADFLVNEIPGHRTHDQKEKDGFQPFAHIGHCSIFPAHAWTWLSSMSSGTAPWPRTTSWNRRTSNFGPSCCSLWVRNSRIFS